MKEIILTQGKVAIVDDEDFEKLNKYKWHINTGYARRDLRNGKKIKAIYMHREILNVPIDILVDHINSNRLDNRKENLRSCTHQQNICNQLSPHKNNKLGIKGVSWCKSTKKFKAQITFNKKIIYLGVFSSIKIAQWTYEKAEKKIFGEFARKE